MTNAFSYEIKWPLDDTKKVIRLEFETHDFLYKYRPNEYLKLFSVVEVLNNPSRIFSNLNRFLSNTDKYLCITGKPKTWKSYNKENEIIEWDFPKDHVFLVFLNERFSIIEFGLEKADIQDLESPKNFKNRYGELLWPKMNF